MTLGDFGKQDSHDQSVTGSVGYDFSWRVHSMMHEWTAKVDAKASIVLTLEVAFLGLLITASGGRPLVDDASALSLALRVGGLTALIVALMLAGAVVFPQLKRRQARADCENGVVYFGHVRHWDEVELKREYLNTSVDSVVGVLATQIVAMSQIAWRKHVLLQSSMAIGLFALVLLVSSSIF